MDERGALFHCLQRIEHGGQLLILHFYQVEGRFRDVRVYSGHRCYFIPEGTDLSRLERRIVLIHAEGEGRDGGPREDRPDAREALRLRRVDVLYPCVGIPAVEYLAIEHPRQGNVLDERGTPRHLGRGVLLRYPFSYGGQLHVHSPFAADLIASMILTYPVHLHRFPSMLSLISSSVGSAFS